MSVINKLLACVIGTCWFLVMLGVPGVSNAYPTPSLQGLVSTIQFQIIFEGLELGLHRLSSYRVLTSLDAQSVALAVEAHWRQEASAKVLRQSFDTAWRVSNLTRFPSVEMIEVSRLANGQTQATLSVSSPVRPESGSAHRELIKLLPSGAKLRQTLKNFDVGVEAITLIAQVDLTVEGAANWFEARAKFVGYRKNPRVRFDGDTQRSFVGVFQRNNEECIVTIDQQALGSDIVLQYSNRRSKVQ